MSISGTTALHRLRSLDQLRELAGVAGELLARAAQWSRVTGTLDLVHGERLSDLLSYVPEITFRNACLTSRADGYSDDRTGDPYRVSAPDAALA